MLKQTKIYLGLIMILLAAILVACGGDDHDPHDPDNVPDKLVIWMNQYWAGEGEAYLRTMMDRYEEQNEHGIEVEVILQQDINTKVRSAIRSGEQVDIVIWDRWETSEFAAQDFFLSLDDYIATREINTDDFVQEALGEMIYNDTVYGLPLDLDPHGIFVNTDAVSELPTTWDELYAAAQEGTISSGSSYTRVGLHLDLAGYFSSFIQTAGGQMLAGENLAGFNTPEGYSVLEYWQKLFNAGVYAPGAVTGDNFTANDPFLNNRIAMRIDSLLNASSFYDANKSSNFEYTFIPFPKGPDADSNADAVGTFGGGLLGGYGLSMFATTRYAYHAFDLIEWWVGNDETAMEWHEITGYIPSRQTILDSAEYSEILSAKPLLEHILPAIGGYRARPRANGYTSVENAILTPKIKALLEQGLYNHHADPIQAALDDMETTANNRFAFGL